MSQNSHPPVNSVELRENAKLGGDNLRTYILGDGTLERQEKVSRANEALALLKAEMATDPGELRKLVVDTTRVILQEELDAIRAELPSADVVTKKTLETQLASANEAKVSALAAEKEMVTPAQYVTAETREMVNDVKAGGLWEVAKYGGVMAAGAWVGSWLWRNTLGRVFRWFRSDPNKPTFFERIGGFASMAGGALLGMLGLRRLDPAGGSSVGTLTENVADAVIEKGKNVADEVLERTKRAANDAGAAVMRSPAGPVLKETGNALAGAGGEIAETGGAVINTVRSDIEVAAGIAAMAPEDPMGAMQLALTKGIPLVFQNGVLAVWIAGKGIVLPTLSLERVAEFLATGKLSDDFWLVWGEAGVAYILGRAAFNGVMYGKLDLPNLTTRRGIGITAARIAGGPLNFVGDAAYNGARALTRNGRSILRMQFVDQSLPARVLRWARKPNLRSQQSILAAIDDWKVRQRDVEFMERNAKAFDPKQVASAKEHGGTRLEAIKAAVAKLPIEAGDPAHLHELKRAARRSNGNTTMAEFGRAVDDYSANQERYAARNAQENAVLDPGAEPRVTPAVDPSAAPARAQVAPPQPSPGIDPSRVQPVPIRPAPGIDPARVQPAPVRPGPGLDPARVRGEPVPARAFEPESAPTTEEDASSASSDAPVAPADVDAEAELTLEAPVERVPATLPPTEVDPNADYELQDETEYQLRDETEYQLAPEEQDAASSADAAVESETAPTRPRKPRVIGSDGYTLPRPGWDPDADGDAGGPAIDRGGPPKSPAPMGAEAQAPGPRFEIPEGDLERRLGIDDTLIDLDDAGSPTLETGDVRPSARPDATTLYRSGVDVRTSVKGDADTDVDTDQNTKVKIGRK